jgi:hypothetical protein
MSQIPPYYAKVIDASVVLASPDPFGRLIGGSLRLSGRLLLFEHQYSDDHGDRWTSVDGKTTFYEGLGLQRADKRVGFLANWDHHSDSGREASASATRYLYVMPLCRGQIRGGNVFSAEKQWYCEVIGLILERTGQRAQYVRIGSFTHMVPTAEDQDDAIWNSSELRIYGDPDNAQDQRDIFEII